MKTLPSHPDFLTVIHCMTFNHALYIEEAMNGFCMQQTTFPFLSIICDDASIDGEQIVIKRYLIEHFDDSAISRYQEWEDDEAFYIYARHRKNSNCFFLVILLKENYYSQNKDKTPLYEDWMNCTKYIAICEGDDYWISPNKLQKQVEVLENNENVGLVFHPVHTYLQERKSMLLGWGRATDFEQCLIANTIPTLSTCFRKELQDCYIKDIGLSHGWLMGDYPLWLYILAHFRSVCLEERMGVYRELEQSASHFKDMGKAIRFSMSMYQIRVFFATKYDRSDLFREFKINELCALFNISLLFDKRIPLDYDVLMLYKGLGRSTIIMILKYLSYMSHWGRKILMYRHERQKRC